MKDNKISNLETLPQPLERIGLADALPILLKHTEFYANTKFEVSKNCRQLFRLVKKLNFSPVANESVTLAGTTCSDWILEKLFQEAAYAEIIIGRKEKQGESTG